ncbi:MAG: methionyl-tRNA formyltransferase [Pseudomonadota bacterium]
MNPLTLAFLGTPDFALPTLRQLIAAGHAIAAVYAKPPKPRDRGQKVQASPVQAFAEEHGLPLRMPTSLKGEAEASAFQGLRLDAAVVVAYGLLLPKAFLEAPRLGCLNLHPSLLPRWRGAAPIPRAILAGDAMTGVTIMRLDEGLDSGPILLQAETPIHAAETAAGLETRLAALGADCMLETLEGLSRGALQARPQPTAGVTYAEKLNRAEGELDWRRTAAALHRRVRAFDPWPGAWFLLGGERVKVLAAEAREAPAAKPPGTVLDDRLTVACGEGAIRILTLQRAGRAPLAGEAFLRGHPIPAGTRLAVPAGAVAP